LVKGEQFDPAYTALNPSKQVPALLIDGIVLTQSVPIIEYLEETRRFQGTTLLPSCEDLRFKVRQITEIINSGIQPIQNLSTLNRVVKYTSKYGKIDKLDEDTSKNIKNEWVKECIEEGFNALETILQECSGKYCLGNDLSVADCVLIPQVYSAVRYNVDMTKYPIIQKINQECMKLDAFKVSHPDNQPDAEKAKL